jgi:hypothetical protein
MSSRTTVSRRVILELEPVQDSIRGRALDADEHYRTFDGWLELSAVLEKLRPRPDSQPRDGTP